MASQPQGPESALHKKASFHLPTQTNPNPQDNKARYPLNEEADATVEEIEDRWGGSSFEGFFTRGSGSYKMQKGELQGEKVIDLYRRFFVIIEAAKAAEDLAALKEILERFRQKTAKNGAPIQESIYLEIGTVEVHFVGEPPPSGG